MNELSINIHRGNYLSHCLEELKRIVKNFLEIYHEFLNREFTNEPADEPLKATKQTEELPKYLWI
jgi:hypothetical protein